MTLRPCLFALGVLAFLGSTLLGQPTIADAGRAFQSVELINVRLFSFMVATGEMVPEPVPQPGDDQTVLQTTSFPFPLDRQFIIGLQFRIKPNGSSGYRLAERDGVRVTVEGRQRHLWTDFYLHGQNYKAGVQSEHAFAWKFVTLDLVCDPTPVDVRYNKTLLRRIVVNGRCPE